MITDPNTEEENEKENNEAVVAKSLDVMLQEKADMLVMKSMVPGVYTCLVLCYPLH